MADAPAEVLESGPGRPGRLGRPGRWRRPWALLLVLAAAAALVGLRAAQTGGRAGPQPVAGAAGSAAEPEPSVVFVPGPSSDRQTCTGACREGRFRVAARPGYGPAGVRLVAGGAEPVLLDLGTGRTTPIPGLPLRADRTATLYQVPGGLVGTVSVAGGGPVGSYLLRGSAPAVRLGTFDGVIPSRDGGFYAFDMGWNPPRPGRLVAFTGTGRPRWQRPFRQPTAVLRDTRHGLLIHQVPDPASGAGPVLLADPRTGVPRHEIGWAQQVLASTDRYVVWLDGACTDDGAPCELLVTDLTGPHTTSYPVPLGRVPSTAAVSPDGRVAVGVGGLPGFVPGQVRDGFVALLDRSTGAFTRLPGLSTQVKHVPAVGWSPDGGWLLIAVQPDDEHDRLVLRRPGRSGLTMLPTVLPAWSLDTGNGLLIQAGE